jgi:hypothetical protein
LTAEDATLHGGAVSDSLVRVDASVRLLSVEEVFNELLDFGDTGGTTNEYDFINLTVLQAGVIHDGLHGLQGVLEKVLAKLLELGAGEGLLEVEAVNEGLNDDGDLLHGGEISLGLLNL